MTKWLGLQHRCQGHHETKQKLSVEAKPWKRRKEVITLATAVQSSIDLPAPGALDQALSIPELLPYLFQ